MTTPPRVTGIGGVFFKVRDRAAIGEWYRRHLGIDVQEGGLPSFAGATRRIPNAAVRRSGR